MTDGRFPRRLLGALALLFASLSRAETAAESGEKNPYRLAGPVHPFHRKAFEIALAAAKRKLLLEECRNVFGDFADREGTPLADQLATTGQSAAGYLGDLRFVDGRWTAACQPGHVYAWTNPSSRRIHLCLDRFSQLARTSPSVAANILIHEELHALGLAENPPASLDITERVGLRCGY